MSDLPKDLGSFPEETPEGMLKAFLRECRAQARMGTEKAVAAEAEQLVDEVLARGRACLERQKQMFDTEVLLAPGLHRLICCLSYLGVDGETAMGYIVDMIGPDYRGFAHSYREGLKMYRQHMYGANNVPCFPSDL